LGPDVEPEVSRAKVPHPDGIAIEHRSGGLRLVRRWFSGKIVLAAFFCVFWDGFLISWYTRPELPLVAKLFPLLHLAVGVVMTYWVFAGFLNSTVIDVGMGQLTIRHRPVPWPGNRHLMRADLTQLFSEQVTNSSRYTSYRLSAVRRDGRKVKLVSGLPEADQALFLEQQIEAYLGIRDQRVGGELPR
jgi:hypothetical protein